MLKLLRLSLRNLRAHKLRNGLTALGVAVAVFVFCFFTSISAAMGEVRSAAGKENNLVVLEAGAW